MRTRAQARRGLVIYLGSVVVMSAALEGWIIGHGGLGGPARWLVLPLMYVPLISSVIARVIGREGIRDVSFRWGGRAGTTASLAAWLLPVLVGFLAYGVAWGTGLAPFAAPAGGELATIGNPVLRFLAMIPLALTVGTLMSCVTAFGEEVGWRGYLVPRLVREIPGHTNKVPLETM